MGILEIQAIPNDIQFAPSPTLEDACCTSNEHFTLFDPQTSTCKHQNQKPHPCSSCHATPITFPPSPTQQAVNVSSFLQFAHTQNARDRRRFRQTHTSTFPFPCAHFSGLQSSHIRHNGAAGIVEEFNEISGKCPGICGPETKSKF